MVDAEIRQVLRDAIRWLEYAKDTLPEENADDSRYDRANLPRFLSKLGALAEDITQKEHQGRVINIFHDNGGYGFWVEDMAANFIDGLGGYGFATFETCLEVAQTACNRRYHEGD